jgi:hypothetical protein
MLDRAQWKCSSQGEPLNSFNTSHITHLRLVETQNHEENHEKPLATIRDRTSSMSPSLYATISHYISLYLTISHCKQLTNLWFTPWSWKNRAQIKSNICLKGTGTALYGLGDIQQNPKTGRIQTVTLVLVRMIIKHSMPPECGNISSFKQVWTCLFSIACFGG